MKNIVLIIGICAIVSSCDWMGRQVDGVYEWGENTMPVKDGKKRCTGENFC